MNKIMLDEGEGEYYLFDSIFLHYRLSLILIKKLTSKHLFIHSYSTQKKKEEVISKKQANRKYL